MPLTTATIAPPKGSVCFVDAAAKVHRCSETASSTLRPRGEQVGSASGSPKESLDARIAQAVTRIHETKLRRLDLAGRIRRYVDPLDFGYSRLADFVKEELGISHRSFQDAVRVSNGISCLPLVRRAMATGMICESRVMTILPVLTPENQVDWLREAAQVTTEELKVRVRLQQSGNSRQFDWRKGSDPDPDSGSGSEAESDSDSDSGSGSGSGSSSHSGSHSGSRAGLHRGTEGTTGFGEEPARKDSVIVRIPCPARHRWIVDAFSEDVARRTGGYRAIRRSFEILLAEFSSSVREDGLGRAALSDPAGSKCEPSKPLDSPESQESPETMLRLSRSVTAVQPSDDTFAVFRGSRTPRDMDAWLAGELAAERTDSRGECDDGSDDTPSIWVQRFRAAEAQIRSLQSQTAELLYEVRLTQAWRGFGSSSFANYVEDRVGVTVRTANHWIQAWQTRSRLANEAWSSAELRTTSLLALGSLERAGASGVTMGLWLERASNVSATMLEEQIRWALAHDDLLPTRGTEAVDPSHRLRYAPPCETAWPTIAAKLQSTPELISLPEFHDAMSENVPCDPAEGAGDFGKISARHWRDILRVPDPSENCDSHIQFRTDRHTLEALDRAILHTRARYGVDKPDWWCVEVMILEVRNGWGAEDRDFRRRTAEFGILARDGFQCTSPRCSSRRNLNVHHIVFRSQGGSDDPSNLTTLCAACHLQGVHAKGTITVKGHAPDALRWTFGLDPSRGPAVDASSLVVRPWLSEARSTC